MSKLYFLAGLVIGAAAGSIVSWKLMKDRYSRIADEEIESVKTEFAKERKIFVEEKETRDMAVEKPNIMDYAKVVNKEGYTNYRKTEESTDIDSEEPYIISSLKFGELEDYECITLKYYIEDSVLTDDDDELFEDPAKAIPIEGITDEFKRHPEEGDVVYTRNDILKVDYEIIMVLGSYDDVLAEKPYLDSAGLTDE